VSKIFKNIKSLFVEEVETKEPVQRIETTSKEATLKNTQNTLPKRTTTVNPVVHIPSTNATESADPKFLDILLKAMEANNLEGLDYLEFKQSLQALSSMPMDEETRFKSAFAMAASMGATPSHLITTAKHYIQVLEQEDKKFEGALQQQMESKIGRQQEEVASMEKSIQEKSEQIKQLTNQITQIQNKVQETKAAMQDASEKISVTKNSFIGSYNKLRGQIESDIEKMTQYFGGNPK
jgi:chromosome segregation ATPase